MEKDISNQTIAVLAILTILISTLSIITIFMATTPEQPTNIQKADSTTGLIKLELQDALQESNSQGQIILEISNQEN